MEEISTTIVQSLVWEREVSISWTENCLIFFFIISWTPFLKILSISNDFTDIEKFLFGGQSYYEFDD